MHKDNCFVLYQLKDGAETRDYRFETLTRIRSRGLSVIKENYRHLYTGLLECDITLDSIFSRFNVNRPADFVGHSLSISDVIVLVRDGNVTAHYVDDVGFVEVSEFLSAPYKYYSTMRPVDIGTIPKTAAVPLGTFNFDSRKWVENATFRAWGFLTYNTPLTQKQMSDYELRAASDNLDLMQISPYQREAQIEVIGKLEKSMHMPDRKRLTWWHNDYGVFILKDFVDSKQLAERFKQTMADDLH